MEKIVSEQVIKDLLKVKDEFDAVVESLELMQDKEFMNSYQKAKQEIKKRDFDNWDEL